MVGLFNGLYAKKLMEKDKESGLGSGVSSSPNMTASMVETALPSLSESGAIDYHLKTRIKQLFGAQGPG
jgi:hypothetical protein